ncbi:sugar transferase [Modestobacter sp. Leaf380]|uniref:sugar transferase n=1 Tax=Modestobacter sp. Leaf380 TaxID=1736356 RepID=UPI0006F7F273|nr:sugar transferase [Modestobacter sp. Leaf380]KQS68832.1 UDP-phosphate galactose phosphotransferase [Modestobacter sp. Leaf380]
MTQVESDVARVQAPRVSRFRFADRLRGEGTVARRRWRKNYVIRLVGFDVLAALLGGVVGFFVRFGPTQPGALPEVGAPGWTVLVLPAAWVAVMSLNRAYEQRFLWIGAEEFRRVASAAICLLAGVGTVSWAFRLDLARGFVVVAIPLATLVTLVTRYAHRAWLHRQRAHGRFMQTTIVVGHRNGVAALHQQIDSEPYQGYDVIGFCVPGGAEGGWFDGVPVLGDLDQVAEVVRRHEVDTVAVLPSPELDGAKLRRLGWELEKTRAELLLAPAVTEVVGPRVNIRPVCGLPLMHVERPEMRGIRRLTKAAVDKCAAALVIVLLLPVLAATAAAVKATSSGPVFYRQQRVGQDGRVFTMLKFRSMVVDAEARLAALQPVNEGNGVLFKMKGDPRVTRVGRVLRRYSLDELPQLLNVLTGQMSLVGPRPPLPREVERYGFDMHRRFLVKPGITGLWQISGRSDLSWDDSVRIDVRYVENWSLMFDFMILWKTVGAVFRGSGAY